MKSKAEKTPPAPDDIAREVGNARHYLNLVSENEAQVRKAERAHDWHSAFEQKVAFLRDLSAFLNAARRAKNYLTSAADVFAERSWLDAQFASPIFKFHANLAGFTFHDNSIAPTRMIVLNLPVTQVSSTMAVSKPATIYVEKHADGSTTFVPEEGETHFIYHADSLGVALATQLAAVSSAPRPITSLAAEYIDGIERVFQNALAEDRIS
jgi:hypothetical protein